MKYLLFILLSFSVFACRNSKNREKVIHKSEKILEEENKQVVTIFDKKILELEEKNKLDYSERGSVNLKRLQILLKKCKESISRLEKTQDSKKRFKIQKNYKDWLNQKIKVWDLNLTNFPTYKTNIWKNIHAINLNKQEVYWLTAFVFAKLGFEDLPVGTYWGPAIEFLVNTQKVAEYETIELWLSPVQRNRDYYYDIKMDKGIIKNKEEKGATFDIVIPSKKAGMNTFNIEIQAKNFDKEVDTTLYFKHQFEVIK